MKNIYTDHIASVMKIAPWQAQQCVMLFEEGATVPFISRYRKERTGGLDETQVAQIRFLAQRFEELEKRKATVVATIAGLGAMTEALSAQIESCVDPKVLEDLYLPYRPKRKTRASAAREKGLEPLAMKIYDVSCQDPSREAASLIKSAGLQMTQEEALAGACDIVSELISETVSVRDFVRSFMSSKGILTAKKSRKADSAGGADKYSAYFNFSEPVCRVAPHRLLAVLRAESEGVLAVKIECDQEKICNKIEYDHFKARRFPSGKLAPVFRNAVEDACSRLLYPSISAEVLKSAKEKADIASVKLFGDNLRQLLLAPPLGEKRVMAIDPGFRTGCKVVCLDASGALLANDVIYPHPPANERIAAMRKIHDLVSRYQIEAIAVGSGTAGRETEAFLKRAGLPEEIEIYPVSEDGASVYSASDLAREEFPQYDVTVRGAVSIGRRLMDPLAELVKIDPKSIGVGQYQHDVDQDLLRDMLDEVVSLCVNSVGVNLNTASRHLLTYVSGIGPALAENIIQYRNENGPFRSRKQLMKVKRLGDKAFEQCAGFLRIPGADNPLDNSAVHPESYPVAEAVASDLGVTIPELVGNAALLSGADPRRYVTGQAGLPTVTDILSELAKPGRDPRNRIRRFEFDPSVSVIDDLHAGMELPGIVTNITAFGIFVDIGIKENGLIHVSRTGGRRPDNFRIREYLKVRVEDVDTVRRRISLSYVGNPD